MMNDHAEINRRPLVSVIVPTFNRPDMLRTCLRSILDQTYPAIEIIVVNDAGIDVSEIVKSLNERGNIVCIAHDRNRGLPAARNSAIGIAKGKYIAYLDDDDIYYPEHVSTLVETLESGDCRVAYTDAFRAIQKRVGDRYVVTRKVAHHSVDFDPDRLLVSNFIPVLCVMHEKSCLDESGLFDESLKVLEDWDLWIRMSREFTFAHCRKITCEVAWRDDGQTMSSGRQREFWRTIESIYEKYDLYAQDKPHVRKARRNYLRGVAAIALMARILGEQSTLFKFLSNTLTTVYNRWSRSI